jgi:hypothetical protein
MFDTLEEKLATSYLSSKIKEAWITTAGWKFGGTLMHLVSS